MLQSTLPNLAGNFWATFTLSRVTMDREAP